MSKKIIRAIWRLESRNLKLPVKLDPNRAFDYTQVRSVFSSRTSVFQREHADYAGTRECRRRTACALRLLLPSENTPSKIFRGTIFPRNFRNRRARYLWTGYVKYNGLRPQRALSLENASVCFPPSIFRAQRGQPSVHSSSCKYRNECNTSRILLWATVRRVFTPHSDVTSQSPFSYFFGKNF